ncbi:hypothetical protein NQ317_008277 [Molorchus minor]|uniref:WAP domain-containing protein n=1 Tax=Molorchus minor TaxID=1323400 RepID=A0ABQ9J9H9_9CUCU|nr:hypothetical protein NQ317_008277 [Molorchus minor]
MYYIQVLVVLSVAVLAMGQFGQFFAKKSGECPPYPNVMVCDMTCFADVQCPGMQKCCGTACGGTMCIGPVTSRVVASKEKPGDCPSRPSGPWVCSSRCAVDSDCRGKKKCCRNRCAALACVNPEEE